MVNVLPFVSMTIEDKYVTFNVQGEGWYFERDSEDMTMNGFGWTPGLNCLHPLIICALYVLCMVLFMIQMVYSCLM